ncbi:hypothetical protein M440DRAFT_84703 [Trichoderma longibrachiatum ATCC 18648]|uniref:Uncharacterized protein n=1 Tax=Trichoderma longibrachiatum ATCC 18648 TaxID=983965 RepID=A0A2T4CIQ8_TRILO|nr:hypothetical protein M440DRAFT_84703 [Trichoderma longibrachiatum ATCC 18648]
MDPSSQRREAGADCVHRRASNGDKARGTMTGMKETKREKRQDNAMQRHPGRLVTFQDPSPSLHSSLRECSSAKAACAMRRACHDHDQSQSHRIASSSAFFGVSSYNDLHSCASCHSSQRLPQPSFARSSAFCPISTGIERSHGEGMGIVMDVLQSRLTHSAPSGRLSFLA